MKKVLLLFILVGLGFAGKYGYEWYQDSKIHTIEFVTSGGSELAVLYVSEEEVIPAFEIPVKDGFLFAGWYTDSTKNQVFDQDVMTDENIVLYADWGSDKLVYTLYQGEYVVSIEQGHGPHVIIPKLHNGLAVTEIGYQAFFMDASIQSIYIPNSIKKIGERAFNGAMALQSVVFEEGSQLITISNMAFNTLPSLKDFIIPASVRTIGDSSMANTGLVTVTFEEGSQLQTIGVQAFSGNFTLSAITFPKSLTEIGAYAFVSCPALISVAFEDGSVLEVIGEAAFAGTPIRTITLPNTLLSIGMAAFAQTQLSIVSIPLSVTTVADNAFSGFLMTAIYVEAPALPEGWDDLWNPTNIYVQWGSTD